MNNKNNYISLGIAFGAIVVVNMIFPVLDGLVNMAISAMNKTVNKWQLDMELDKAEAEAASEVIAPAGSITHAIGFSVPNPVEEEEYYEDE